MPVGTLIHAQDVSGILEQCAIWRSKTDTKTDFGIQEDLWHYARIPNVKILEMKQKYGVDFYDEGQKKEVFHLINTVYAEYKTTHKNHMKGTDKKYFIAAIKDSSES